MAARASDGALSLFHSRFVPRQEGGTNVPQVWVEVKALQAQYLAASGKCDAALAVVQGIGAPEQGLDFTANGLEPFVDAPRTQVVLAGVELKCGRKDQATERLRKVAQDD